MKRCYWLHYGNCLELNPCLELKVRISQLLLLWFWLFYFYIGLSWVHKFMEVCWWICCSGPLINNKVLQASQMWGFAVFLCFMSLKTEYVWVLDCGWVKRRHLKISVWCWGTHDGYFSVLFLVLRDNSTMLQLGSCFLSVTIKLFQSWTLLRSGNTVM